jgi:hypothetical protein
MSPESSGDKQPNKVIGQWEDEDESILDQLIDESELGCPPDCISPFCSCPGTD